MGSSVSEGRALKCRATQSMDGPVDGHMEGRRGRHAAAFHDTYLQFIPLRLEGEAQAGGRRLASSFARAKQHDESAARFGGDRQAAQFFVSRMAKPSDQAVAGT